MFALFIGCLCGAIAGIIPGIGNAFTIIVLWPLLINMNPIELIIFFIALTSLSQYMGSVSATIFGLMGETSSLPAVIEGNTLFRRKFGSIALSGSALGSFFGSFLSIILTWLIVDHLISLSHLLTNAIETTIMLLSIVIVITISNINKKYPFLYFMISLLLAILGAILASVGVNEITRTNFATFNNPYLMQGIPFLPVLFSVFIFPEVIKSIKFENHKQLTIPVSAKQHIKKIINNTPSVFRGTIIGYVCGLIPAIGTTIASNVSYLLEKYLRILSNRYKKGDYASLVAAETANNSAAFSSTLPLFIFGIPITLSEILLIQLVSKNNFYFGVNSFVNENIFLTVSFCLLLINFIGIIVSWTCVNLIKYVCYININYVMTLITISVFCSIMYQSFMISQFWYYLLVILFLIPIGIIFKDYNRLPLVFVFLIYDIFWENAYRFILI